VVGILQVTDDDEMMLITGGGKILRMQVRGIPMMGRNTQGVNLMDTSQDERVVAVARVAESDEEPEASADVEQVLEV